SRKEGGLPASTLRLRTADGRVPGVSTWRDNLLLAGASIAVTAAAGEGLARVAFRMSCHYAYAEHSAFLPHPALVFQNNPQYHVWRDQPERRFDFFFIPPLAGNAIRPR